MRAQGAFPLELRAGRSRRGALDCRARSWDAPGAPFLKPRSGPRPGDPAPFSAGSGDDGRRQGVSGVMTSEPVPVRMESLLAEARWLEGLARALVVDREEARDLVQEVRFDLRLEEGTYAVA